jgi:hypothetical protein
LRGGYFAQKRKLTRREAGFGGLRMIRMFLSQFVAFARGFAMTKVMQRACFGH